MRRRRVDLSLSWNGFVRLEGGLGKGRRKRGGLWRGLDRGCGKGGRRK
jgi:hypothetical protein